MVKHFHIALNHKFTRTAKRSISIRFSYEQEEREAGNRRKKMSAPVLSDVKNFCLCDRKITQNKVINYKTIAKMNAKMRTVETDIK